MKAVLLFIGALLLTSAVYLVIPRQYDFDGTLAGIPPTGKYRCKGFTYVGSADLSCIDCGFAMYCQGIIVKNKAGEEVQP